MKGWKTYTMQIIMKRSWSGYIVSDKADFRPRTVINDRGMLHNDKRILQEDRIIQTYKTKLDITERRNNKIHHHIWRLHFELPRIFTTPSRQKMNANRGDLNNQLTNQLDIFDIM